MDASTPEKIKHLEEYTFTFSGSAPWLFGPSCHQRSTLSSGANEFAPTHPDSTDETQDEVDSVSPVLPRMRGRPPKPVPIPATPPWFCPSSLGRPPRAPTAPLIRGRLVRPQDGSDHDDTPLGNKVGRPKSRTLVKMIPEKVEELSLFIGET
jgi:hypothetical protein